MLFKLPERAMKGKEEESVFDHGVKVHMQGQFMERGEQEVSVMHAS